MSKLVHGIYLAPSDKVLGETSSMMRGLRHLQAWYQWRMGNMKTFTLAVPSVAAYQTIHSENWYQTNPRGGDPHWYFWNNVLYDGNVYGGAHYGQDDDYVIWIDAQPSGGIGGASTGNSGICVLSAQDIRAIRGIDPDWTLCRAIGGCGHELGHTFGLPHPPQGSADWPLAIMGWGFGAPYASRSTLTDADKEHLNANPFFTVQSRRIPPAVCPFIRRDYPARRTP